MRVATDRLELQRDRIRARGRGPGRPAARQSLDGPLLRAPLRRGACALPAAGARHARVRGDRAACRSTPRAGCATGPTTPPRCWTRSEITAPPHLVGWSTGGAAIAAFALERPVASLTFIDPVAPVRLRGDEARRHAALRRLRRLGRGRRQPGLRGADRGRRHVGRRRPGAAQRASNSSYWRVGHREPPEREDMLVGEILKSVTGDDGYPGDAATSEHWPGVAPGHARDPQRALAQVLQLGGDRRPDPEAADPVDARRAGHRRRRRLAVGAGDARVARRGAGLAGRGRLPAAADGGPDPRGALEDYAARGGRVETEWFEESGHFPPLDSPRALERALLRLPGVALTYAVPGLVLARSRAGGPARPRRPERRADHGLRARGRRAGGARRSRSWSTCRAGRASRRRGRPARRAGRPGWTARCRTSACCCSTSAGRGARRRCTGRESAEYLTHFRADSIVRDAELLRAALGSPPLERARPELRRAVRVLVPLLRAGGPARGVRDRRRARDRRAGRRRLPRDVRAHDRAQPPLLRALPGGPRARAGADAAPRPPRRPAARTAIR